MHGGKGAGAPKGNQNAVTSGDYCAKRIAHRFFFCWLMWCVSGDDRYKRARLNRKIEVLALATIFDSFDAGQLSEELRSIAHEFE